MADAVSGHPSSPPMLPAGDNGEDVAMPMVIVMYRGTDASYLLFLAAVRVPKGRGLLLEKDKEIGLLD